MTCPTTPSGGNVSTVHAALQVSGTGWILAVGDPADASRTGLHRLAPHDVDGLPAKPVRARERAAASGGDVRVMLVYEAGYEGFRVARRPGGEDLEVVVRHPASLEVVRRSRKKGRTDRTGARGMVRALRAWDGGDRDAMSPVRVPTVAEEEGRRLLRRRGGRDPSGWTVPRDAANHAPRRSHALPGFPGGPVGPPGCSPPPTPAPSIGRRPQRQTPARLMASGEG